jgi:hypothetical protein
MIRELQAARTADSSQQGPDACPLCELCDRVTDAAAGGGGGGVDE